MPINNAVMIILPPEVAEYLDNLTTKLQTQQLDLKKRAEAELKKGASKEVVEEAKMIAASEGTKAANYFLKEQQLLRKAQLFNFTRKATRTSTALRILQLAIAMPELENKLYDKLRYEVANIETTPIQTPQNREDYLRTAGLKQAQLAVDERRQQTRTHLQSLPAEWSPAAEAAYQDELRRMGITLPTPTNGDLQRRPRKRN